MVKKDLREFIWRYAQLTLGGREVARGHHDVKLFLSLSKECIDLQAVDFTEA